MEVWTWKFYNEVRQESCKIYSFTFGKIAKQCEDGTSSYLVILNFVFKLCLYYA